MLLAYCAQWLGTGMKLGIRYILAVRRTAMSRVLTLILCALFVGWMVSINLKPAYAKDQNPSWGIAESAPIGLTVTLSSIKSIGVPSLTEEALHDFVELKMRVNDIPIATNSAASSFDVIVFVQNIRNVDGFAFVVQGNLTRPVTIVRTGKSGKAKTWSTGFYMGTSSRDSLSQQIRLALESLVEKFSLDYLRANPR